LFVYSILGSAYQSLGDFSKAIEYHMQCLAIDKEVGGLAGGKTYLNLGCAYQGQGDYGKAIEHHTQTLAIAKEVGDRAGEGKAYRNLGNTYKSIGNFSKAIKYHTHRLAIAKCHTRDVGDRAWEGRAYGSLGNAYFSQGHFAKAIEYHTQHLAIAKEVGDRAGEKMAYASLGTDNMHLNEYVKAVAWFEAQHALATSQKLEIVHVQSHAVLNMGVALTLHVWAARQSPATDALLINFVSVRTIKGSSSSDEAPGPPSHSSASACLNDRVREAAKWLQAASDGHEFAKLHLARLTFEAGQEDATLAHLQEHLSWVVQGARDICAGCWQTLGEDTPMLTCSGCRVARFCSADHQKMASKKAALGGSLKTGRHKDICGVLSKWREVVKDGVAPDSCTADLVASLQR